MPIRTKAINVAILPCRAVSHSRQRKRKKGPVHQRLIDQSVTRSQRQRQTERRIKKDWDPPPPPFTTLYRRRGLTLLLGHNRLLPPFSLVPHSSTLCLFGPSSNLKHTQHTAQEEKDNVAMLSTMELHYYYTPTTIFPYYSASCKRERERERGKVIVFTNKRYLLERDLGREGAIVCCPPPLS